MTIINFKINDNGKIISVSYDSTIVIRNFILDFLHNNSLIETLDRNVYVFKCNGKILNSDRFLDKKLGECIPPEITVHFVRKLNMSYSGGIDTVDVSKNITKECKGADSGPSYREGCNGLNIRSICKNSNCRAYNDTIYVKIGYVENWNLSEHIENQVLCPCCGGLVKPKNYYFYECNYQIDYVKEEGEAYSRGSINGIAKDEKYKYFDEKESGNAIFVKLVFHVTKLI